MLGSALFWHCDVLLGLVVTGVHTDFFWIQGLELVAGNVS